MVRYALEQSPLFRLPTLGALCRLLKWDSPQALLALEFRNKRDPERFYHRHTVGKRDVQALRGDLKAIHRRLYGLLARLETPGFLVSSRPGSSYVDNAKIHQDPSFSMLSLDITKFFARTRHSAVLRFFLHRLQMAPDLAHLLANLCCYQERRLPLGSPISQPLAFWANESLFWEVADYAKSHHLTFSVFIDDLTFSSEGSICQQCHRDIQAILVRHGMTIHWKKIKYRPAGQPKVVTGCLITSDGLLEAPQELMEKATRAIRRFRSVPTAETYQRALGIIHAVRAIVPSALGKDRVSIKKSWRQFGKPQVRAAPSRGTYPS